MKTLVRLCWTILFMVTAITSMFGDIYQAIAAEPIRVMSFNIRYGTANDGVNRWENRRTALIETVTRFNPDLLGTQETLAFQRDYLLEQLSGFQTVAAGRDDGKEAGEMAVHASTGSDAPITSSSKPPRSCTMPWTVGPRRIIFL
jgi:hypothetical protein